MSTRSRHQAYIIIKILIAALVHGSWKKSICLELPVCTHNNIKLFWHIIISWLFWGQETCHPAGMCHSGQHGDASMNARYLGWSGMVLARGGSSSGDFGKSSLPVWPWRAVRALRPAACMLPQRCRPMQLLWHGKFSALEMRKQVSCYTGEQKVFSMAVEGKGGEHLQILLEGISHPQVWNSVEELCVMLRPARRVPGAGTALKQKKTNQNKNQLHNLSRSNNTPLTSDPKCLTCMCFIWIILSGKSKTRPSLINLRYLNTWAGVGELFKNKQNIQLFGHV